jgi:hypothetical protein
MEQQSMYLAGKSAHWRIVPAIAGVAGSCAKNSSRR